MSFDEEPMGTAMSEDDGPYLFDVGVIALAHTDAPVRDAALSYVRDAITGEIDAIVPYTAVFGAHAVLSTYYGRSNAEASRLLENFMSANRIRWYDRLPETLVNDSLENARAVNIGSWDGYYAQVAIDEGVNTLVTIDDDFETFEEFDTDVILSSAEFQELNAFLEG